MRELSIHEFKKKKKNIKRSKGDKHEQNVGKLKKKQFCVKVSRKILKSMSQWNWIVRNAMELANQKNNTEHCWLGEAHISWLSDTSI